MAAMGLAGQAWAGRPVQDRFSSLDPRPDNQFGIESITLSDYAGFGLVYRRGFVGHLSLGVRLEYTYPDVGYGQLQGFNHSVELTGWVKRPWIGPFFSGSFSVGHAFMFSVPSLSAVALGGGVDAGWAWDLTEHLGLAFSMGIRNTVVVRDATQICTLDDQCIVVREAFVPRFALTFGYRF
ncbi:hypothetical protein PPSIR1_17315 [Plesiocystis pacifica SIR-1]|uniref:Outer membrane protein beta-barrel domain-containing protein n=2 Tax=Plesiocystis pacifica TaxID=191768 RepID=A6GA28_9BACT|nr:hypothetical protein PPSIR1_17315 [Plesiocystis pacifica SIR-1]